MRMAGRKRSRAERERDRARIAELHLAGRTQAESAGALGLSQQTVSLTLRSLRDEWRERATLDTDAARSEELARLDGLQREYWEGWQRSQREQLTSRQRRSERRDGAATEASVERQERDGTPAFLAGVLSCIDRRIRLLGLDAPVKVAPTDPEGQRPWLPVEELRRREKLVDEVDEVLARLAAQERGALPPDDDPSWPEPPGAA